MKKLLSSGSPLTGAQKDKMKAELHAEPSMGHARKGSAALKRPAPRLTPASAARIRAKVAAVR